MANDEQNTIEVMGVKCVRVHGDGDARVWRGGMRSMARALPNRPWLSVRVECHSSRDGAEHWIVVRKLSFRDGDPDVWGSGTRHKARFYFEGQGPTLNSAVFECECAEEYMRNAAAPSTEGA